MSEIVEARPATQEEVNKELSKDLGIGSSALLRSQSRFLSPDGTFNVVREGLPFWRSLSAYHWLLTISWPAFFGVVATSYYATNVLFALAYIACGPDALQGLSDVQNPESRFWESFFFSVHTLATIGYGTLSPRSFPAHIVVSIEALFGLLGIALATGLLFARFSRPTAKILFSENAVVAPYRAGTGLMFRVVNARHSQLIQLEAVVSIGWEEIVDGKSKSRFETLALERKRVTFLPLHWVVVHPIDEKSPLAGMTEERLRALQAEMFVMLSAVDETFSQTVYARRSYTAEEIVWNARFTDIYTEPGEGRVGIDVRRLSEIERL